MAELALIGGAMTAGGGVMSMVQGAQIAKGTERAANYNADLIQTETDVAEKRLRRDRTRRLASLRAAVAGRGVSMEGSPLEVMFDQALEAEEEIALLRYSGKQRAASERYAGAQRAGEIRSQSFIQGLMGITQGALMMGDTWGLGRSTGTGGGLGPNDPGYLGGGVYRT